MTSKAAAEYRKPGEAHVTLAPHAGEAHRRLLPYCLRAVAATPGLHCVSHYGSGVFDFSVDAFHFDECDGLLAASFEKTVEDHMDAGRRIVSRIEDFDRSLTALNSGELMRMLVETGSGSAHCGRLRSGEYLVGTTLSAAGTASMDRGMDGLVTGIRKGEFRLGDENPGGDPATGPVESGTLSDPHDQPGPALGELPQAKLFDLWSRHLTPADLHYAALYQGWSLAYAGDVFDHPELSAWFTDISLAGRRSLYQDIAQRLRGDLMRLRRAIQPIADGPIGRLVLDVQAGALYVHWLGSAPGDFVLGLTLFQDRVDYAEHRLRGLIAGARAVLG